MRLHTAFFGINSLLVATLLISGCSLFKKRNTNAQLIPPSANGLQAPIYPPTNFLSKPPKLGSRSDKKKLVKKEKRL